MTARGKGITKIAIGALLILFKLVRPGYLLGGARTAEEVGGMMWDLVVLLVGLGLVVVGAVRAIRNK